MKKLDLFRLPESPTEGKPLHDPEIERVDSVGPLPVEVVVMAGGRGERLQPLTDNLPKPLLEVGGKPIVEWNIDRLRKIGAKHFTFCVNYLGEQIKTYFGDGSSRQVNISYLAESEPLGTIGGLHLKNEFVFEDLLVINGDLLTTIDYKKFYDFFIREEADLAVATIPYQVNLPYGILQITDDNEVTSIHEKPSYTHYINTGIYLLKKDTTQLIPKNRKYDAIQLIEAAMAMGLKVSSFPLLDYWVDIGQMEDYHKAQKDIKFLNL